MKRVKLFLILPALLNISGCSPKYSPKKLNPDITYDDVYLIMGQSNASGVSPYSFLEESNPDIYQKYLEGNSKVLISYDVDGVVKADYSSVKFGYASGPESFGPEIGIAEAFKEKEATCYLIKASWSGSCLQTQYIDKNGNKYELYKRFVSFIKEQLNALSVSGKHPRVRGVFWMQGESDTFVVPQESYRQAEQKFYEYLRIDINPWIYEYFNFVDAYISTTSISWFEPEKVNACKQSFADENEHCYCIKTNGEDETALSLHLKAESGEGEDTAHYDSSSMLELGKKAGEYLLK